MSDLETLKDNLLAEVTAAGDEAAIEAVRVNALGKKGSISELLKTLGTMTPEERQTRGAAINALKTDIFAAITARKSDLKDAAIAERLARETVDISLRGALLAGRARPHPPDQPDHRRDHRDLRRHGVLDRRRSRYRDRLLQFHRAELPRRSSGP